MLYKYHHSQHFCWVSFEEVDHSYSHRQRIDQFQIGKHRLRNQSDVLYHFLLIFASCPVAATDIAGAGFILTIPDAEDIVVVVIVEGEVRVPRILLLAVVIRIVA